MPISKLRPAFTFTEDRLRELQAVVPEAFADGKINWDTLREALGENLEDETKEHFGLFWPGKREARRLAAMPSKGTLIPQPGAGVDEENTHNLFIEGDNLEVLKLLQKSYAGRVELVYIDPPYNTGDDFIYPDDYVEPIDAYLIRTGQMDDTGNKLTTANNSSGRIHSKWLSMMYPRLVAASEVLKDEGAIVIHIDEHEFATLLLLMNEIFGEENNLGTISWDKKNPKGDATGIAYQHESIVIYAKNRQLLLQDREVKRAKKNAQTILNKARELFSRIGKTILPDDLQKAANTYDLSAETIKKFYKKATLKDINEEFSAWIRNQDFSGGESAYSQIDENGEVFQSVSMAWPNKKRAPDDYYIPLVHPVTQKPCPIPARGWRNPPQTMKKLIDAKLVVFGSDDTTQPRRKYLLRENMSESIPSILPYGGSNDALLESLGVPFDNPKPVEVAKQLIQGFSKRDGIVLDCFAGSCTAAHAVMDINTIEDNERKFIMIQFPEPVEVKGFKTIADIGRQRIKNTISLIGSNGVTKRGMDLGFKCFVLQASNFVSWELFTEKETTQLEMRFGQAETPLVEGWQPENLLVETLLIQGFPLDSRVRSLPEFKANEVKQVTSECVAHHLYICLDKKVKAETVAKINLRPEDILVCLDSALSDEAKVKLADQCNLKVI